MSGSALHHRPPRSRRRGHIFPEGDEQLSRQVPRSALLRTRPPLSYALMEPLAQRRMRLVSQPQPGELDHGCSQPRVAGLGRRLVRARRSRSARASAPVRHKRQPGVGWKSSGTSLRPEDGREVWGRSPSRSINIVAGSGAAVSPALSGRSEQRISLSLHGLDLLEQEFEPIKLAADLRLQMRRQRTTITGPELSSRARRLRRSGS